MTATPIRSDAFFTGDLADQDPELFGTIAAELTRQQDEIDLIASENIVSRAVMAAQGSVMTNKYAEGYPGRRYYGGCQHVDVAEELAIARACARPAGDRLRCVRQSSTRKPGGSPVPGASAWRISATCPPSRNAAHSPASSACP